MIILLYESFQELAFESELLEVGFRICLWSERLNVCLWKYAFESELLTVRFWKWASESELLKVGFWKWAFKSVLPCCLFCILWLMLLRRIARPRGPVPLFVLSLKVQWSFATVGVSIWTYIPEQTRKWSGAWSHLGVRVHDPAVPYGLHTEAVGTPMFVFPLVSLV